MDIDVLSDLYKVMKEYVPSKDRQTAADHVCNIIADSGISDNDLKAFCSDDAHLLRAYKDNVDDDDEEEQYYEDLDE